MKSTNINWIGNIPNDWKIRKVKHCFYISKTLANDKDPTVLSLARSGVKVRDISTNEGQLAASYDNYNIVKKGDLLLNPMDLYSGANCNVSEVEGVISPAYVNLRAKEKINSKYFDYFFKTQYWGMAMFAHGKGVSFDNRWTMNSDAILNYYLPFPSVEKQNAIVAFLNEKCKTIDSLIELENKQIDLLKEFKKCMITEKITKGLIFDNAQKESGIPWIGKIPQTWSVDRIKSYVDKHFGGCWGQDSLGEEPLNPRVCIRIADFDFDKQIAVSAKTLRFYTENQISRAKLLDGDIILEKSGGGEKTPVGRTVLFNSSDYNNEEVLFANFCECLRPKNINNKYLLYCLKCFYLNNDMHLFFNQTTGIQNLDVESVLNEKIAVPSKKEQDEIVEFLDEKCMEIDNLIGIKNSKIEKLNSYKKSLIFEYTTGKREVVA